MQAKKIRVCLLMSKYLNEELKLIASEQEMSKNMLIQVVLKKYVRKLKEEK